MCDILNFMAPLTFVLFWFLCMKKMMSTKVQGLSEIKQRGKGSCRKNLRIPQASYLAMLPPRSTKKEHSAAGRRKKERKNNPQTTFEPNCRKTKEKTSYMLLAKCQAFPQICVLQQEGKRVKVLCEILNDSRMLVFSTGDLDTVSSVPVEGKLTSEVSSSQGC